MLPALKSVRNDRCFQRINKFKISKPKGRQKSVFKHSNIDVILKMFMLCGHYYWNWQLEVYKDESPTFQPLFAFCIVLMLKQISLFCLKYGIHHLPLCCGQC